MNNKMSNTWPGWETVRLIGRGSLGAGIEIQRKRLEDAVEVEKAALKVISIPQNDSDIEEMYNDGYDEESVTSSFRSHLKSIVAEYSLMRKMNGSANIVNCDDVRYEQHADGIGWDIYIKMELLTPLAKSLPGTVSDTQVIAIAKDMCEALELCDKHNIVHRDIKPQNIFLSPNGDYKLGDFGIAKTVEKTMGGTKTGTYKYMAPEVYNNRPYNSTADIYSLGLVLYWLLNERRMPFIPLPPAKLSAGMDEESRQRRFAGEAIPAPKNGSAALKKIVLKACAFDPKDRYQSAREMREDLQRLSGAAVPVVEPKSVAVPETAKVLEAQEEATVGPVFARNVPPVAEDQDKTVGPTFVPKKAESAEEDKTVGPTFASKKAAPLVEEKTVGPQFTPKHTPAPQATPAPKPVKKKKTGVAIVAAVLVLVGLCAIFFSLRGPKPKYTLMEDSYENTSFGDLHKESAFGSNYQRHEIRSITFLASIKDAPADSWDVSQEQNGTVLAWAVPNGNLYDLYIGAKGGVLAPQDCRYLFGGFSNLKELNFNGAFDTSNVTDMARMFVKCISLAELDVSAFDTSNVTDMEFMFFHCLGLTTLDLSSFNTTQVTSMYCMFSYCSGLEKLDVSSFNTSKVTNMRQMFHECNRLKELDLSNFKTANVTNMGYMFYDCCDMTTLDVSNFDTSKVTAMDLMFERCSSLTKLDVSSFDTSAVTDIHSMFAHCYSLTEVDVSGFDTSNVTNMRWMFLYCRMLKELDVSNFNTAKVTETGGMFEGCSSLTELDVSGFDTSNVTDMSYMFYECSGPMKLDVSHFDISKVQNYERFMSPGRVINGRPWMEFFQK